MEKQYLEQAGALLKVFDALRAADDWQPVVTKEETSLSRKERPEVCALPCYLVRTVINKPKNVLVDKIWAVNEEGARRNDPKLTAWREVERGNGWKVCSQYNAMSWPIWPRHTVFAQVRIDDEKDTTKLVGFSVEHPKGIL